MSLPLYREAREQRPARGPGGHAGLWFDKFCDRWRRIDGDTWTMTSRKGDDRNNPKLKWIETLTNDKVGAMHQLEESALRVVAMIERRGGSWAVFTTAARFVTGLGRSHPVENGFAWHPTLGTPYLPGSSVKGLIRAWAQLDAAPKPDDRAIERLLGSPGKIGSISLLDAIPIKPVRLEADVMTPHYAGWTEKEPPGDWRSPTPIPFLVTAAGTPFLFGLIPRRTVPDDDLKVVNSWLRDALAWNGSGAKTAVGYGRFAKDAAGANDLTQRLHARRGARDERIRREREAAERAKRLAAMSPVERQITEFLDRRKDKNTAEYVAILQAVERGKWTGEDKIEAAKWLETTMHRERRWKEKSGKKNPAKDSDHQRTLQVKRWLTVE